MKYMVIGEKKEQERQKSIFKVFFINSRGIRGHTLQCPQNIKEQSIQRFTHVCRQ